MAEYRIEIFFSDEDGGWIAKIPDLAACSAFGETPEEALAELRIAAGLRLETARETGKPISRVKSLLGLLDGGPPDLAERHREYILQSLTNGE